MNHPQPRAAAELVRELTAAGVRLWREDDQLRFRAPKGAMTERRVDALRSLKADVLDYLRQRDEEGNATHDPAARFEPFPLTDVQAAYLLGRSTAYEYGGVACHGYLEVTFPDLDAQRLNTAWQRLVERHDMLRTVVHPDGYQQTLPEITPRPLTVRDLRGAAEEVVSAELSAIRAELSHRFYTPEEWPLYEVRVTHTDDQDILHLSIDLLIADYRSIQLLLSELNTLYAAPGEELPALEITFRDYVTAERRLTEPDGALASRYDRDRAYWWDRLDDLPAGPELPLRAGAEDAPARFQREHAVLGPEEWASLKRRAGAHNLSASGAVLAAYAEVIGRWSRRPHYTLNLTTLNPLPLHPQVDQLVGDFTSVSLLEVDSTEGETFAQRASTVQDRLWADLDHRLCTGVQVMRELGRRRGRAEALMPVVFTSAIGLGEDEVDTGNLLALGELGYGISQTPQVWVDCQVMERQGSLLINWDIREGVLPHGVAEDAFATFRQLLLDLSASDGAWQTADPVVLPAAQLQSRQAANGTHAPLPEGLLHEHFLGRAVATPADIAVVSEYGELSYQDLLARALSVADELKRRGTKPGELVAVSMEKGAEQVAAVLGTLLADCAYLPIDTSQPVARRAAILDDAGVCQTLVQSWTSIPAVAGVDLLAVDELTPAAVPEALPSPAMSPDDLAYVIYTSGSTGVPKGVAISHRAALNTITDVNRRFSVTGEDRVLGLAHLGFDLSVYDIFGPLSAGGALVLPQADRRDEPSHWSELITNHRVTVWNSVPAQMQILHHYLESGPSAGLSSLRLALLSGDWIPVSLPEQIRNHIPGIELISLGGATEAAIWSIAHPIGKVPADATSIPYGMPLANQSFHILDTRLRPVPEWTPGELYIAGAGLAEGYLGDKAKTEARFINHPGTGERLYRTGDLGRYLPDGVIEFLGREDFQVKVRGHRIELAEVEAAALKHPAVESAAALVDGDGAMDRRLVAFAQPAIVPTRQISPRLSQAAAHAGDMLGQVDRESLSAFAQRADETALMAMARALRTAGLFTSSRSHSLEDVLAAASPRHHRLLRRWLRALTAEGWLQHDAQNGAFHTLHPVDDEDLQRAWADLDRMQKELDYGAELLHYLRASAGHLPQLLAGELDPLTLLFPEGEMDTAQAAYRDNLVSRYLNGTVATIMREIAAEQEQERPLRVLEVGAGVGGTSHDVISALDGYQVDYLFSDLSQFFLNKARERFADRPWVRYGTFDLNGDHRAQGFEPNSLDVILCANVLHNSHHAGNVLESLTELLAPGGRLLFIEATRENYPLMVSMEFHEGLSGGFEDARAGRDQTFFTRDQWLELLHQAGAHVEVNLPAVDDELSFVGQHVFCARVKTDRAQLSAGDLTAQLSAQLPGYMIPAHLQVVDALPVTENGKVDRTKLKRWLPSATADQITSGEPPRDDLERRIAALWSEHLDRASIGRDDDFFEMGGDSLIVAQLVGRMRNQLPEAEGHDWDDLLRQMLRQPTVAGIAAALRPRTVAQATLEPTPASSALTRLGGPDSEDVRVLVHDGSGTLAPYRPLISAIREGTSMSLVGVELPDWKEYIDADTSGLVERLAAEHTERLLELGTKRFHVVGYCMGGLLATGIANRLREKGADVAELTIVSSYRIPYWIDDEVLHEYAFARAMGVDPDHVGYPTNPDLAAALQTVLADSPERIPAGAFADLRGSEHEEVARCLTALGERGQRDRLAAIAELLPGAPAIEHLEFMYKVFRQSLLAVAGHDSTPYEGDITLLRQNGEIHVLPQLRDDMTEYWQGNCTGDLRVVDIGGDHFTCLQTPHVSTVTDLFLVQERI
ncbi:non-ribosomal peptide synthetase [Streptomyces oceani]|uniref:Phenyloxazoline synthase MbtB n=1 Tax=Streptomyces oceani TaxID=1075402 RepID=A0A1E7KP34_9ACTN|nr:non-ribosomal peptide synthetase [Streptomyces oceani]OEV05742.1 non-ribosomal peptide synthetase [Streptomyces oceani]